MRKLIYIFLLISLNVSATNYYVKNGGSDGAAGTSDGTAWASIQKVNAESFSAGDSIFFNKGDKFIGSLIIGDNGSSGNPIVFGAYGTGDNPILTPNDTIEGITWINHTDTIWKTVDIPYNPGNLLINWGNKLHKINDAFFDTPQAAYGWTSLEFLALPHDTSWTVRGISDIEWWDVGEAMYCYNSDTTYIRFRNGENPNDSLLCFAAEGVDSAAIHIDTKNYITIQNLEILGGEYGIRIWSGGNHIIENCTIKSSNEKIRIGSSDAVIVRNCTITNNYLTSYYPGAWGVGTEYKHGINFNYYSFLKTVVDLSSSNRADGAINMEGGASDNSSFYNNTITNCANGIGLYGADLNVYSNSIIGTSSSGIYTLPRGPIYIYDNYLEDNNIGIRFGSVDVNSFGGGESYIYKNRFYIPDAGELIYIHYANVDTSVSEAYIYHNSFLGRTGVGISGFVADYAPIKTGFVFVNNIISAEVNYNAHYGYSGMNADADLYVWDYNWSSGKYHGQTSATWIPVPNNIPYPTGPAFWDDSSEPDWTDIEGTEVVNAGIDISQPFTIDGDEYSALPGYSPGYYLGEAPDMGYYEFGTGESVLCDSVHIAGTGDVITIEVDNGTLQMLDTIWPANATFGDVTWSIENETGTATISEQGLVQAVTDGTVEVKGTTQDGQALFDSLQITISNQDANTIPTVTTTVMSAIHSAQATTGGNATANGGASITAKGVCWSLSPNPTISDFITVDGTGTGAYTSVIRNLSSSTRYYVRAYAINSEGTAYGEQRTVLTTAYSVGMINGGHLKIPGKVLIIKQ